MGWVPVEDKAGLPASLPALPPRRRARQPGDFKASAVHHVPLAQMHFQVGLSAFSAGKAERRLGRCGARAHRALALPLQQGERAALGGPGQPFSVDDPQKQVDIKGCVLPKACRFTPMQEVPGISLGQEPPNLQEC